MTALRRRREVFLPITPRSRGVTAVPSRMVPGRVPVMGRGLRSLVDLRDA